MIKNVLLLSILIATVSNSAGQTESIEVGNAPPSLVGERVTITPDGQETTILYFTPEDAYDGANISEGSSYTYTPNGDSASLLITKDSGAVITYDLSFSTNLSATGTKGQEAIVLEISDQISAPSDLTGFLYKTTMGDTFQLKADGNAVFYIEGEDGEELLENVRYSWIRLGPAVGKFATSLEEETWLFYETNATGDFHLEDLGSQESSDGDFTLSKIGSGNARNDLAGDLFRIGENQYLFDHNGMVTVTSATGAIASKSYAYIQTGSETGILSVPAHDDGAEEDPQVWNLTFSSAKYGIVEEGGEYFDIWANWSTKGWVWYDDLPWIYSNNQGDWLYQNLFFNESNETELEYFESWSGALKASSDLNYTDQRIFETPSLEFPQKSYPKGWMWTEFYPWAYSYETGDWIYFELGKDAQGQAVMNYWDRQTNQWDIYEPALAPLEQR